jgi:hypothetical protein
MRGISIRLIVLAVSVLSAVGFVLSASAAPGGHNAEVPTPAPRELPGSEIPLPLQEQRIVLDPFFQLRSKDSKFWIERIIVTFLTASPKEALKDALNGPAFRMKIYDLLQSEEPEPVIRDQILAGLGQQLGMRTKTTVEISRSIMIVR